MSKHDPDEKKVSPLVWLIPVPFLVAAFLPLHLDPSRAMYKADRVAAAAVEGRTRERPASAPRHGNIEPLEPHAR
jgi:hypothetical protein